MNEGIKDLKGRVVSPDSGDYNRNKKNKIQIAEQEAIKQGGIFGASVLSIVQKHSLDVDREFLLSPEFRVEHPSEQMSGLAVQLEELKDYLIEKTQDDVLIRYVRFFFLEFFTDEKTVAEINTISRDDLVAKIKSLNDDLFLQMLSKHLTIYASKLDAFKIKEKKLRKNFLYRLNQLKEGGVLDVNIAAIKAKIDKFYVSLEDYLMFDPIHTGDGKVSVVFGATSQNLDMIVLSGILSDEQIEHTYNHEMFHAVSGNTSVLLKQLGSLEKIDESSGLVTQEGEIETVRSGLGVRVDGVKKFTWLTEAVTEKLALLVSGEKNINFPKQAYLDEILLLETLLMSGHFPISLPILYHAYFLDSENGVEMQNQPLPVQSFMDAIDESYGKKNFLYSLDAYVSKYGVTKTVEVLKSNPDKIENM